ncbi:hypothetical protein CYFUS_000794 [Cystobacter fuscus]|uniref:Uncharacterized protein n=1 Tax=Cystobacter fuscus TaxID=43 RepID=A0A250IW37_9BACT|nr:hypothetical protein [Cystobacter fuscus]ATB35381.1 hypothetical protein CYFUS_000794 [Cystobacter fuscus]
MIATLKTLLTFILAGAFGGLATASWLGPKWLEWDNTTRIQATQTMCNLPEVIRSVTAQLLGYQLTGTGVGAGIGLVLGIVFLVMRSKKQKVPQVPPAAPPPAAA